MTGYESSPSPVRREAQVQTGVSLERSSVPPRTAGHVGTAGRSRFAQQALAVSPVQLALPSSTYSPADSGDSQCPSTSNDGSLGGGDDWGWQNNCQDTNEDGPGVMSAGGAQKLNRGQDTSHTTPQDVETASPHEPHLVDRHPVQQVVRPRNKRARKSSLSGACPAHVSNPGRSAASCSRAC